MTQLALASAPSAGHTLVCRLTPSGRVDVQRGTPGDEPAVPTKAAQAIIDAFASGRGPGVLHLAVVQLTTPLLPSLAYFRELGKAFVAHACGALDPSAPERLVMPEADADELLRLALAVPPMPGAELLSAALLAELWLDLGHALATEAKAHTDGVPGVPAEARLGLPRGGAASLGS